MRRRLRFLSFDFLARRLVKTTYKIQPLLKIDFRKMGVNGSPVAGDRKGTDLSGISRIS